MRERIVSAAIALLILAVVYFVFRIGGLMAICGVATLLAIREFTKLTFRNISSDRLAPVLFSIFCFVIYLGFTYGRHNAEALFAILSLLFVAALLTQSSGTQKLSRISLQQGLGVMGFVYCGLLPALATRLLQLPKGDLWFFTLLAVVFLGDSSAYFVGKAWGKTKLMPKLSPSKTIRGSLGGLFGSMVAGALAAALFFPHVNTFSLAIVCLITGCFAQVGDLFESLLKRVAQVKDSGHIMPGHGGILDRLDGVLFGAPIFYYLIQLFGLVSGTF